MAEQRIVVIEDDEDIQELLSYNLGKEGCQVAIAGRGEKGLSMIHDS